MVGTRLFISLVASAALAACGSGATRPATGTPPAAQGVSVEIRPARISVLPGETVDFATLVTGTADPSVTWEVVEKGGGTVSGDGKYVAPLALGDYTVRVSSTASPGAGATAKVKVGNVAVAVSPRAVTVAAGGTATFVAKVTGTRNDGVTWSIREASACGTIGPSGDYAAPPAGAVCHVVATSVADPTAASEASATVTSAPPPVAVTIAPGGATVDACRTVAFTATVSGSTDGAVTWTVQEGSAGGAIAADGVYTAPAAPGTYHVVATSRAAPGSTATVAVTVAERILAVAVSPATVTLAPGGSASFTATVTNTCGTFATTSVVTAAAR